MESSFTPQKQPSLSFPGLGHGRRKNSRGPPRELPASLGRNWQRLKTKAVLLGRYHEARKEWIHSLHADPPCWFGGARETPLGSLEMLDSERGCAVSWKRAREPATSMITEMQARFHSQTKGP